MSIINEESVLYSELFLAKEKEFVI